MDVPITPDNTRVRQIMDDFQEFVRSTNRQSSSGIRSISYHQESIPFNIEDKEGTNKRPHYLTEALQNAKMAQIESKHVSDERAHKMARLDLESRNEKLISENKLLKEKCDNYQLKVKQVTMQAIEAQDKFQELRKSRTTDKEKLEEMLLESQKEKEESERNSQLNIDHLRNSNDELRQRNTHLTMQINILKEKHDETATLLTNRTCRVEKLTEILKDHESCEHREREYQIKVQDLELRLSRSSEAEQMSRVMKDDLERLHKLELEVVKLSKQNDQLRENESNVRLMKEKLSSIEAKLARNEKLVEKAALTELENKDLITQLNEAKNSEIKNTGGAEIMSKITDLQQNQALNAIEKSEIQSQLSSVKSECQILQTTVSNLEESLREKDAALTAKDTQIRHLQKRAFLYSGERSSLRSILQSYDSELTTSSHANQLLERIQNSETANEKVHARLIVVEKEAQSNAEEATRYKLSVTKLESTVARLQKQLEEGSNVKLDEKEVDNLRKKIEDLEKERSELQKEKEHFELWVEHNKMKGDYDPSKVRVVHFKMNPADLAHNQSELEVAKLKNKCIKLQEKIIKLEANLDVTMTEINLTQGNEFNEKLAAAELKNQRLKEVFSKRIHDFRQACHTLTGYRIDYTADTQFKLVPMYAENETDYLLFKMDSSGTMQLLETEYSKTLQNFIELHLHHQNSIPMFLSSVTADLFSQQTMLL